MFQKIIETVFPTNEELPKATRDSVASYCFVVATTVLFFLFSNLLITSIVFLVPAGHVTPIILWISILLTAIFAFFYSKANLKNHALGLLIVLITACAIFLVAILANQHIYDISYDGQTYQQEGVIQLTSGWNPVYQYLSPGLIGGEEKWINYYPKASWINEAYLHFLTGSEQSAKALNIILIIVSIALVYAALADTGAFGTIDAIVISVLLGCNPVSISESLSFYIDGQLMSLFLCIVASFIIMYSKKRQWALLPLFFAISIFINLKFTAVVDAIILLFIFGIAGWVMRKERLVIRTLVTGIVALAVGGLLIGASPYITNIIRYQTPFYPLLGAGAIDLKPDNVPGNFIDKNSAEIMVLSFFSQSAEIKGVGTTNSYKIPFTYSTTELATFENPDPDEGGFGPLFGGAIIAAFLIMLGSYFAVRKRPRTDRLRFWAFFGMILVVIALSVIDPIASLARYVPQAYLLAVLPIIFLFSWKKNIPRTIGYIAIALLVFNSYLIAQTYIAYNIQTSAEIASELGTLKKEFAGKTMLVLFNEFKSTRVMIAEAGINYTWTADPHACTYPDSFQEALPGNTTEFCLPTASQ